MKKFVLILSLITAINIILFFLNAVFLCYHLRNISNSDLQSASVSVVRGLCDFDDI